MRLALNTSLHVWPLAFSGTGLGIMDALSGQFGCRRGCISESFGRGAIDGWHEGWKLMLYSGGMPAAWL